MSARELITEHLDLWTGAVTKKSSSGRGSNGKVEQTGVKKLRELILGMAVQGKLTTREARDEPASDLLQRISTRQTQLYTQGKIKKRKKLPRVSVEEEYFHLPENWEWTRLGALFDSIMSGGTPSKQNPRFWDGDIPWASVKDLGRTKHLDETQDYITGEGLKAGSKLADTGDVLICTRMGLGKVAICSKPIAINQDLKAVKVSPEVSLDYFFLAYTTLDITGTGTTVAGITQDKLLNYVIGLPPIEEQRRIVQKVDELMALCDRLERQTIDQFEAHETLVDTLLGTLTQSENATKLADNWARFAAHFDTLFTTEQSIDKLKQAILQLAVMGRLVEQDAGDEPASAFLERLAIEREKSPNNKKGKRHPPIFRDEEPFGLPKSWNWARLGNIALLQGGLAYKSQSLKTEGTHQVVRMGNIRPNKLNLNVRPVFIEANLAQLTSDYRIRDRSILMTMTGTKGKKDYLYSVLVERQNEKRDGLFLNQRLCMITSKHVLPEFLQILFLDSRCQDFVFKRATGTANQANIGMGTLEQWPLPIPPKLEQQRIVRKINELMALCNQLKERLNQAGETRLQLAEATVEQALS